MITKQQAIDLGNGTLRQPLHCNSVRQCTFAVGSRGGEHLHLIEVRPTGRCQTWKTRPEKFRLPVKYGLYAYGEVNERNASEFHLACDCQALKAQAAHRGE